ncbi:DELTA-stichotoxin-Hcr4b-like [Archocentrus centrarchus]|uniref:DELTA-stichotoxin-Hcr4b-like n=1 Tax=Archocentrus centrarchus TaxID=63155 RepID=UPI0011E9C088|nr:DELTA-stichotoxin-Hcr4b-like [Archocentrus centrarchus]
MPNFKNVVSHVEGAATVLNAATSIGVQAAELLPTHRQCSIELKNGCSNYTLLNPSVHKPLPLVIDPSSTGSALFMKTPNTACGAVGVFTYDLRNKSTVESTEKLAVMFSVPYDFNLYSNWCAVGIFDKSKECNYDLYYQMYNKTDKAFTRGKAGPGLNYKKDQITIMALMTDSYEPVIEVEVRDA